MDAQVLKQWESDRERLRAWCAESALFALKAFVRGDRKMGIRTTFQAVEYASRLSGETLSNVYMRDVLQFLKLECESHVG